MNENKNREEIREVIERNYKFNFLVNVFDGAFYTLGMGFISVGTILPLFLRQLTESKFLISMITAILMFGANIPQIFSAKWIRGLDKKKKSVLLLGFLQRLPWLLLAISTFILAPKNKNLLLLSFFILWAFYNITSGLVGPPWFDLVSKVIPQARRGRFFGYRTFLSSILEVLGAIGAGYIIKYFKFRIGFTILFSLTFVAMMISYIFLMLIREPAYPVDKKREGFKEYFQDLFIILKKEVNYRKYLISIFFIHFVGMADGLFTVASIERLDLKAESTSRIVGIFTVLLIVSKSLTNIFWGYFGDKYGHKLVILSAAVFNAMAVLAAFFAQQLWIFYLIFIFNGIAVSANSVSFMTIIPEFCSAPEERPVYIGITNTIVGLTVTIVSLLGGFLADISNYRVVFGISFMMIIVGITLLFIKVKDPRFISDKS